MRPATSKTRGPGERGEKDILLKESHILPLSLFISPKELIKKC